MKKVLKNISRVLFSLLLIVSIFGVFNVLAQEIIFKVTNISVKEKSDKVTVNDVSISGGAIVNDIVFSEKDDYITYNITFKNNTNDKYKILSITDDNDSEYLDYTYDDLSNTELNGGDEKTFNLTITYKKETNNLTITDKAVSLTLTYEKEDGTTGSETITNPKTGDNITLYIILGLISVTGLVITTVSKKHLSKSLMVIALTSTIILPLGVKADSDKFAITFTTNKIENSYADMVTGKEFNLKIYELVLDEEDMTIYCYSSYDDYNNGICTKTTNHNVDYYWLNDSNRDPKHIKRATDEEYNLVKDNLTEFNLVSLDSSKFPIYMWYDNNIIYYYTTAKIIFLNEDSSHMFQSLQRVESIDLKTFNTSRVKNFQRMFDCDDNLETLDLSNFDTSNATDMSGMFAWTESLETLNLRSFDTSNVTIMNQLFNCSGVKNLDISSFNTSNVTNMDQMFDGLEVASLDLSRFNTSKLTSMYHMFSNMREIKKLDLTSFDTSKVTNMKSTFSQMYALEELDLSSFYTSNVTDMSGMFMYCDKLETIYVSNNFTTDRVTGSSDMFYNNQLLKGGAGTTYNDYHTDYEYARIDDPDNGKPGYFTLKQN